MFLLIENRYKKKITSCCIPFLTFDQSLISLMKVIPRLIHTSSFRSLYKDNLKLMLFLLLMFLTKFVPKSTIRRCYFCSNFFYFNSKLELNLLIWCHICTVICYQIMKFKADFLSFLSKWCQH
jgi:hypothetical protein